MTFDKYKQLGFIKWLEVLKETGRIDELSSLIEHICEEHPALADDLKAHFAD